MYDGRRQEYLIDLKDGQIDQLRTERDAALALLRRIYARDLIGWSDPLSKEVYELLRRKQ
jgi:hypothetical protein